MAFSLFGRRNQPGDDEVPEGSAADEARKPRLLDRMRQAVARTRESLSESISQAIALTRDVDESTLRSLEPLLLSADIGSATTQIVLENLRQRALRANIESGAELKRPAQARVAVSAESRGETGRASGDCA